MCGPSRVDPSLCESSNEYIDFRVQCALICISSILYITEIYTLQMIPTQTQRDDDVCGLLEKVLVSRAGCIIA